MTLTLVIQRQPTRDQARALLHMMARANAAGHGMARPRLGNAPPIRSACKKLVSADIRATLGLSAQMTVRAISTVAEADQRDQRVQPPFRPPGAIGYDPRILSWKGLDPVSIWTVDGRQRIPVVRAGYHRARLDRRRGPADLIYRDGVFDLAVVAEVSEPPPLPPKDWLGVDLGIFNRAADSDGHTYSGGQVDGRCERCAMLRQRLQQQGTQSAKRLLKHRRRQEPRLAMNENHRMAKPLVTTVRGTRRGMALDDLTGIRDRLTAHKLSGVASTVGHARSCGCLSSVQRRLRASP